MPLPDWRTWGFTLVFCAGVYGSAFTFESLTLAWSKSPTTLCFVIYPVDLGSIFKKIVFFFLPLHCFDNFSKQKVVVEARRDSQEPTTFCWSIWILESTFQFLFCLPKILTDISVINRLLGGFCFSNSIASSDPWTWAIIFVRLLGSLILWVNGVYTFSENGLIIFLLKNIWYKSAYRVEVNFTLAQSFGGFLSWSLGPPPFFFLRL